MIWIPILIGMIAFAVFNSTFFIPKEYSRLSMYGASGGILIGWGFGMAYSQKYKLDLTKLKGEKI